MLDSQSSGESSILSISTQVNIVSKKDKKLKKLLLALVLVPILLVGCGSVPKNPEPGLPVQPTYRNIYVIAELYAIFEDGSLEPMNGDVDVIIDAIDSEGGKGFAAEKMPLDRKAELHFGEWRWRMQVKPDYIYSITLTTIMKYTSSKRNVRLMCKIASDVGEFTSSFADARTGGKAEVACSTVIQPIIAN